MEAKSKETYPFNTEKVTVALKDARNTLNYIVLAFCDNLQQGRAIRIKDKQLNGFKIEVEDCPTETRGAKSVTNWKVAPYGSAMQSQ